MKAKNIQLMFYFYEPIHFKSSAIRYIGNGQKIPSEILSKMSEMINFDNNYYKKDTEFLFPKVGKINLEIQKQNKLWIVPFDEETAPYIKHAFITSHHNNMMCILMTSVNDFIPTEIKVNTDYILLEGGMSQEIYREIYEKQDLVYYIQWGEYKKRCNIGECFLVNLHTKV